MHILQNYSYIDKIHIILFVFKLSTKNPESPYNIKVQPKEYLYYDM